MNYRISLSLILFFLVNSISSQETLLSILDSLSYKDRKYSKEIYKSEFYLLSGLDNRANFMWENKRFLYLNSYKDYSIYSSLPGILDEYKYILRDAKNNKCFMLVYHIGFHFQESDKANEVDCTANFGKGYINEIIELDASFNPINSLFIASFFLEKNEKKGDVLYKSSYMKKCSQWYYKSTSFSHEHLLNIGEIEYLSLVSLIDQPLLGVPEDLLSQCGGLICHNVRSILGLK